MISLQYLGAGGWLFTHGDCRFLTAPFFSNPGLLRTGLGTIRPDDARIDAHLPEVRDVTAILAGHSHYDHLMDVPRVVGRCAPGVTVYGNDTMTHVLAPLRRDGTARLVSVQHEMGDETKPGAWTYLPGRRVRFMALRSEHAPHFLGIKLYCGEVTADVDDFPTRAGGWKEGQTLAFLIDFLDSREQSVFRLHYQDAGSRPPLGFPPPLPDRPVDLTIFCVASYTAVSDYPEGILRRLLPRHMLLGHWEDFFSAPRFDRTPKPVALSDPGPFIRRMQAANPNAETWKLPNPGEVIAFAETAP